MFYLVRPDMKLQWVDLPVRLTLDAIARRGADLGQLEWLDADRPVDQHTLPLALRPGIACSVGIAVPAVVFTTVDRPSTIAKTYRDLRESEAAWAAQDEVMEAVMPGWKANGQELAAEMQRSTEASLQKAQAAANALLAVDPKPELIQHWKQLSFPA